MRSLQWMLNNWKTIDVEKSEEKPFEKYFRSSLRCKYGHPPIRYVNGRRCVICSREASVEFNKLPEEKKIEVKKKKVKNIDEEKYAKQKYPDTLFTKTLEKIKSGVVYIVLGRCESGSL